MKIKTILKIALGLGLFLSQSAFAYTLGSSYSISGTYLLDLGNGLQPYELDAANSFITFGADGILTFQAQGISNNGSPRTVVSGRFGYDTASLSNGSTQTALTILDDARVFSDGSTQIGRGRIIGESLPTQGVALSALMNGLLRFNDTSFHAWVQHHNIATGEFMSKTDYHWAIGAERAVPEPMTMTLLGAGLIGAAARRKKAI